MDDGAVMVPVVGGEGVVDCFFFDDFLLLVDVAFGGATTAVDDDDEVVEDLDFDFEL